MYLNFQNFQALVIKKNNKLLPNQQPQITVLKRKYSLI